ncbi:MAG: hypothetical protein AAF648_06785 [Pseudomonadota bacterium]
MNVRDKLLCTLRSALWKGGVVALLMGCTTDTLRAHEVSASTVRVFVDGQRLELWQTTPLLTAQSLSERLSDTARFAADISADISADERALEAVVDHWTVESGTDPCSLKRQAHRRTHHDTQLQLRYLFTCVDAAAPLRLRMDWIDAAPPDHFVIFEVRRGEDRQTQILRRGQVAVQIERGG